MDHGQVEGLRQFDEAGEFLRRVRRPAAGVDVGVRRGDGDRPAVEPGQPGDDGAPEPAPDLEETAAVHDRFEDGADLVHLAAVARHRLDEELLAAVRRVAARAARRQVERRRRQVGEEAPGPFERLLLALDLVVDGAVGGVDRGAAELLLGHRLAEPRDDGRAGDEHLRPALDDERIMAGGDARGAEPRHRAERQGDDRHRPHIVDDEVPRRVGGDVGVAVGLQRAHRAAAAGALDEADQRQAELVGHLLGGNLLGLDPGVRRAAADGEIIADDDDAAPVEPRPPEHHVGGAEGGQPAVAVVFRLAGDGADLVQAAAVEERVEAFADGEPAVVVLARDLLGPAHLARQRLAPAQLADLRLPAPLLRSRVAHRAPPGPSPPSV